MSALDVKAKSVIITGGCSGIGLAIATLFAEASSHIAILDFAPNGPSVTATLQEHYPSSRISFHTCDVTSWEAQAAIFKTVWTEEGRIDYVFANAGIARDVFYAPSSGEDPEKPDFKTLDVCLNGCMYSVHLAIHYMRKSKEAWKGMIICTASDAGLYAFHPAPIYAAAKHGVVGLVRAIGQMMALEGIHVNGLAPNYLKSGLSDPAIGEYQICTPMTSITKAVDDLIRNPTYSGKISEVSGDEPGFYYREQVEYPDETSVKNFQGWWDLAAGGIEIGPDGKPVPKVLAETLRAKAGAAR